MRRDITGDRFGHLEVVEKTDKRDASGHSYYKCKCDCGNIKLIARTHLVSGKTISCGCHKNQETTKRNTTHNLSKTRLFGIWMGVKKRCYNPHCKSFKYYGARGISVDALWLEDFKNFYDWSMNNGYKENLTIERINVNGNYEPSNCTWIPFAEQAKNRRTSLRIR